MRSPDAGSDILRSRILGELYLLTITACTLAAVLTWIRDAPTGDTHVSLTLLGIASCIGLLHQLRNRLSISLRTWILFGAFLVGGGSALLLQGVHAPGAITLLQAVFLAWTFLDRKGAVVATTVALALFATLATIVLGHGPLVRDPSLDFNSNPAAWINLGVLLAGVTVVGHFCSTRLFVLLFQQEGLQREQLALRTSLLDSLPEAVLTLDEEGRILGANSRIELVFARPPEAILGKRIAELLPGWVDSPSPTPESTSTTIVHFSTRSALHPEPSLEWEVSARNHRLEGQEMTILTFRDLFPRRTRMARRRDALRLLEARIQERTAQLEIDQRASEEFAYAVSHDLRSPLRAVNGFSLAILEDHSSRLSQEDRARLASVMEWSRGLELELEDMLSMGRIDRKGQQRIEFDHLDLLRRAAHRMEDEARHKGSSFSLTCPPGSRKGMGDPTVMRLLWSRLLHQIKDLFPPGKDVDLSASLAQDREGTWIVLRSVHPPQGLEEVSWGAAKHILSRTDDSSALQIGDGFEEILRVRVHRNDGAPLQDRSSSSS